MSDAAWRDDDVGVSVETVSRMLGVPIPTIRSWERRYGVPTPARTAGGHRRYSHADALELRAMRDEIGRGRDAADAAALLLERRASPAPDDRRELTERFVRAAGAFDPGAMEDALERAAADLDVADAVLDVALPAAREIGFQWQAGTCDVAQEHVATEAIRRWLGRLRPAIVGERATVVLACGPNDLHTMGIEAFSVLLADAGAGCVTLGAQVPATSLVRCVEECGAAAAVISSHVAVARRAATDAIRRVAEATGATPFYAGAAFVRASARKDLPGIYLGEDFRAARDSVIDAVVRRKP